MDPCFSCETGAGKKKIRKDIESYFSELEFEYILVDLPAVYGFLQLRELFQKVRCLDDRRLDFGECHLITLKDLEELTEEKKHLGIYEER